ncbi:hypothetical protein ARG36_15695 [Listeria monocytogenes]|nr:hypothetical protein [Listeria monocytogenes]
MVEITTYFYNTFKTFLQLLKNIGKNVGKNVGKTLVRKNSFKPLIYMGL